MENPLSNLDLEAAQEISPSQSSTYYPKRTVKKTFSNSKYTTIPGEKMNGFSSEVDIL